VSLLERWIFILSDNGLDAHLTEGERSNMIEAMTFFLKRKQIGQAFDAGLDCLSRILTTTAREVRDNELPDGIIEDEGI